MSYKTVLLFIDTCDGISSTFSAIEVGSDIDVSTISYPQPPQHDGFLFCSWDKTVSDVAKIIAAESSKAINFIEVHAEYSKAYVVTFVDDYDGMVISKQNVAYGGNAAVPEYPCHGKYVCICWDKDITSVKSDIEAHPVYVDISSYARKSISHKVINNLRDIAAIQNSLKNIFTWIPGERVLLPEFGS